MARASAPQRLASVIPLTGDQRERLERYAQLVTTSPHNLVSRRARDELWDRHIGECLALAHLLPSPSPDTGAGSEHVRTPLLDVGSGGGLPGMVLAVARPDLAVTLVEATGKKATFLARTARELEVDVRVVNERAETLTGGELAGAFELVTARALAPLRRLIPWTVPFLTPSGLVYALKGERWRAELDAADQVLRRAGARIVATPDEAYADVDGAPGARTRVVIIGRVR